MFFKAPVDQAGGEEGLDRKVQLNDQHKARDVHIVRLAPELVDVPNVASTVHRGRFWAPSPLTIQGHRVHSLAAANHLLNVRHRKVLQN